MKCTHCLEVILKDLNLSIPFRIICILPNISFFNTFFFTEFALRLSAMSVSMYNVCIIMFVPSACNFSTVSHVWTIFLPVFTRFISFFRTFVFYYPFVLLSPVSPVIPNLSFFTGFHPFSPVLTPFQRFHLFSFVLVILYAHVKRLSVSRMQDFH